jgi:hypothetical protein
MRINYFLYFFIILFGVLSGKLWAQDDCTVKLNQAQKLYEEGKIEKIPALLSDCLESGFNKENKVAALRLLTLVYLFDDNTEMAEKNLVAMLGADPEYKVNPNVDPVEFIRLYKSFRTNPVFSLGAFIGNNTCNVRLIQVHTLNNYKNANTQYKSNGMGFTIGVRAVYHISNKMHLGFEPMYASYKFSFSENVTSNAADNGNQIINYLELPLQLSYDFFKKGEFSFYGTGGAGYGKYMNGTIDIAKTYPNKENADVTGSSVNAEKTLKPYMINGNLGLGVRYHIPHGNIQLGVRYKFGINNIANTTNRKMENLDENTKSLNELYFKYDYAYDDISLSSYSILVGYNYEFFIHKKKNKR